MEVADMTRRTTGEKTILLAIAGAVLCAQVLSFAYFSVAASHNPAAAMYPVLAGDSQDYVLLADNMLAHHVFSDSPDLAPSRERSPGYPILILVSKVLTNSLLPIILLQIVLGCLAAVLTYLIARAFVSPALSIAAALLYGLDPIVIFSNTTILTDGICSSLLICAVYLGVFQSRLRGPLVWAAVALILSVATLIRPIIEVLVILAPLALLWREKAAGAFPRPRTLVGMFGAYILVCAFILMPWMLRNERVFHSFEIAHIGVEDILAYDVGGMLDWRQLQAEGRPMAAILIPRHINDPMFAPSNALIQTELARETPPGGDPENSDGAVVKHFILGDPFGYAYFHLINTVPFFLGGSVNAYIQAIHQIRDNSGFYAPTMLGALDAFTRLRSGAGVDTNDVLLLALVAIETIFWLIICALCAVSLFVRRFEVYTLVAIIGYLAVATGALAIARYRIPAEPYL